MHLVSGSSGREFLSWPHTPYGCSQCHCWHGYLSGCHIRLTSVTICLVVLGFVLFFVPPFVSLPSHLQLLPCVSSIGVHECAGRRRRKDLHTCVFHLCWSSMFPVCLRAAVIYNVPCAPEVLKPPCCTVMNVRRSGTMCGLRNEMNGSGNTFCFQDTLLLLPVTYWSIVGFSKLPFPSRTLTNPLTRSTHTAHVWTLFPGEDCRNFHESLTSADNLNAWGDLVRSCTLLSVS